MDDTMTPSGDHHHKTTKGGEAALLAAEALVHPPLPRRDDKMTPSAGHHKRKITRNAQRDTQRVATVTPISGSPQMEPHKERKGGRLRWTIQ
jgi:hypothetical protein